MKRLVVFLILFNCGCLWAQNYRVFQWNSPHLFAGPNDVKGIKIDSSGVIGSDSVFYNFFSIDENHPDSNGCINVFGPSWIGDKIVVVSDSLNILFNYDNDSIFFHPLDSIGSYWKLYSYNSNHYIRATITGINSLLLNGVVDSVKEIKLTEYDQNGFMPNSPINNKYIKLSKNHGLVQLMPFRDFPNNINLFVMNDSLLLTKRNVYDFDIGDTLQYLFYFCPGSSGPCPNPYLVNYRTKVVTAKNISLGNDTVNYEFWEQLVINTLVFDSTGVHPVSLISDTIISETYSDLDSPLTDLMPEESDTTYDNFFITFGNIAHASVNRYTIKQEFCGRTTMTTACGDYYFLPGTNCFPMPFEPTIDEYAFSKGLGQVKFNEGACVFCGTDAHYDFLHSYRKANSLCGTITLFNAAGEIFSNNHFARTYPNPADDHFIIDLSSSNFPSDKNEIEIYDITGKSIEKKTYEIDLINIDVKNYKAGIYTIRISNEHKNLVVKLVKI